MMSTYARAKRNWQQPTYPRAPSSRAGGRERGEREFTCIRARSYAQQRVITPLWHYRVLKIPSHRLSLTATLSLSFAIYIKCMYILHRRAEGQERGILGECRVCVPRRAALQHRLAARELRLRSRSRMRARTARCVLIYTNTTQTHIFTRRSVLSAFSSQPTDRLPWGRESVAEGR